MSLASAPAPAPAAPSGDTEATSLSFPPLERFGSPPSLSESGGGRPTPNTPPLTPPTEPQPIPTSSSPQPIPTSSSPLAPYLDPSLDLLRTTNYHFETDLPTDYRPAPIDLESDLVSFCFDNNITTPRIRHYVRTTGALDLVMPSLEHETFAGGLRDIIKKKMGRKYREVCRSGMAYSIQLQDGTKQEDESFVPRLLGGRASANRQPTCVIEVADSQPRTGSRGVLTKFTSYFANNAARPRVGILGNFVQRQNQEALVVELYTQPMYLHFFPPLPPTVPPLVARVLASGQHLVGYVEWIPTRGDPNDVPNEIEIPTHLLLHEENWWEAAGWRTRWWSRWWAPEPMFTVPTTHKTVLSRKDLHRLGLEVMNLDW